MASGQAAILIKTVAKAFGASVVGVTAADERWHYKSKFTRFDNNERSNALEEDVLVVVLSEFTRTPKLNADNGKDHWPVASAFLFGAGIQGSRTIGKTSETLGAEPVNLATGTYDADGVVPDYSHLIAGILEASGVDSATHLPGVDPYTGIIGG